MTLEGIVEKIRTNEIHHHKDDGLSYGISWVGSIPAKMIFLDYAIGSRPQKDTINQIKRDLKYSELENVTVRVGHSRVLKDTYKLFTDKKLDDISIIGKVFLGIPSTIVGGLVSKLMRADYYNPFTKTVHCYSNVEAIASHELGHAKDFKEKKYVSLYALARSFWLVTLYQEFKGSQKADKALPTHLKGQTARYLVPAFITYLALPLAYVTNPIVATVAAVATAGTVGIYQGLKRFVKSVKNKSKKKSRVSTKAPVAA